MSRTTAGGLFVSCGKASTGVGPEPGFRGTRGPMLMWIGPVTSSRTRLENDMFSKLDPGVPWNLIGQPYTLCSTQLETETFAALPPPKRKTDQRVLKYEFVTVTFRQLPKSAQASSSESTTQLEIVTYSALMK